MVRNVIAVSEVNPSLTISKLGDIYRLDARASMNNLGAVTGLHTYILSGIKQTVDMSLNTPVVLQAGIAAGNVSIVGNDASKAVTGDAWNASATSSNSYDPSVQDFACTWLIESTTGTIREMAGITTTPNKTDSYTDLNFAAYQVNNYIEIYENGIQIKKPNGSTNFGFVAVGDRIGVRVVDKSVEYIQMVAGNPTNVIVLHTSINKASGLYYFDCALHKGISSSGTSYIKDVLWHISPKQTNFTIKFVGEATSVISQDDSDKLKLVGIILETGATYSNVHYTRTSGAKYNFDIDVTYYYSPATNAIISTIIK